LFPIVYQWTQISKLSSVGMDLYNIVCMCTKGTYLALVILLVILFTYLSGTQLPPLSEEPYAPMVIKINASKEYARPLDGLGIILAEVGCLDEE